MKLLKTVLLYIFAFSALNFAQGNIIRIDDNGIMRWTDSDKPAYFWGVNYTTPFAFSYRAIKNAGLNHESVIDNDIMQFKRLGLNAYRIHVWDREVSDRQGNLIDNDHIRLLDYLITKLIENDIYIILTPIAWWGTGYPEPDCPTEGFSSFASKLELTTKQELIDVQKNYLKQFINHVNRYSGRAYKDERNIIAFEVINEPNLPMESEKVTDYVNQTVKAIRSAGTDKPVFFNISENPAKSQWIGVANSDIQGVSFQWYPAGLVKTNSLNGNFLPHISSYPLPDYSEKVKTMAKMVYEFDAADIAQPVMYPVMANSFWRAGMQWATMFSYDPTPIADNNAEYITHYLNLVYTPAKAISFMIAGELFRHGEPLMFSRNCEKYSSTGVVVNYNDQVSLLNGGDKYYYSNSTGTAPLKPESIKYIAGVGNSPIVKYNGTGSYFLDRIEEGIWKLEIFPDAVWLKDPFGINNLSDNVAELIWDKRNMEIKLPGISKDFYIYNNDNANTLIGRASENRFNISPGSYIISNDELNSNRVINQSAYDFNELKKLTSHDELWSAVKNSTSSEIYEGDSLTINVDIYTNTNVTDALLYIRRLGWRGFQKIPLLSKEPFKYFAEAPKNIFSNGILEYFVSFKANDKIITYPGRYNIEPDNWSFNGDEGFKIRVKPYSNLREIYNPLENFTDVVIPNVWQSLRYQNEIQFDQSGRPVYKIELNNYRKKLQELCVQIFVGNETKKINPSSIEKIILELNLKSEIIDSLAVRFIYDDNTGAIYKTTKSEVSGKVSFNYGRSESIRYALLPRPYPTFLPYWFKQENIEQSDCVRRAPTLEFIQIALPLNNIEVDSELNTSLTIKNISVLLKQ